MRGWFEKRFDYRQALSASTPDDQNELVDRYLHRGCSPSCATLRSCSMRASIRLAERGLNPCSSGPFEFRSESGVDPCAFARTAGGDLKGRARGADPPPWRLQGFARGGSFGDFLQVAAPHVVDIPVDRNRLEDHGWLRIRFTSATTPAALSFIVSQSINSPSVDPGPLPTSRNPLGVSSAVSRLLARRFRITSSVKNSMPQSVW